MYPFVAIIENNGPPSQTNNIQLQVNHKSRTSVEPQKSYQCETQMIESHVQVWFTL